MSLDPTLAEPIAALGALAAREGDWSEVAKLLESEVGLATSSARKGAAPARAGGRARRSAGRARARRRAARRRRPLTCPTSRACSICGAASTSRAGNWQAAAEALDRLAARGATIADAAERYFAVGAAAEAAGQLDRALTLYSRSYARDGSFRPTLERLVGDLLRARAVGQRLEGDRGAARSSRRRARARARARRCWSARRSPTCTSGSASRRSPSWARS